MITALLGLIGGYAVLAAIVWLGAYFCMRRSDEPIDVKPIRSADDWFV